MSNKYENLPRYTRAQWIKAVRLGRRNHYNSLSEDDKKAFLKHTWKGRKRDDYYNIKYWNKLFPGMIE